MKYAEKLRERAIDNLDPRRTTRLLGMHVVSQKRPGLVRRYVQRSVSFRLLNMFPRQIADACIGISLSKIDRLKPHVHTEEQCVINLYLNAGGASTIFYEGPVSVLDGETEDNGNKYLLVKDEFLKQVESFEAHSGDVWLLDSRQPHAVCSEDAVEDRWALQMFLSITFSQAKVLCGS